MARRPDLVRLGRKRNNIKASVIRDPHISYLRIGSYFIPKFNLLWKLGNVSEEDRRLMRDLNLADLGDLVANKQFSRDVFAYILANPVTTKDEIEQQRLAVKELAEPERRRILDSVINSIYRLYTHRSFALDDCPWPFFLNDSIQFKIYYLDLLNNTITNFENLGEDAESRPLQELATYARDLRASEQIESLPVTLDRARNTITITTNLDITGKYIGKISIKRASKVPRVPYRDVLRTLGHKFLATVTRFGPYKSAVNEALKRLILDNQRNFANVHSLLPDFEFYRAMIKYDEALGENGFMPEFSSNGDTEIRDLRHPIFVLRGDDVVPNDYYSNGDQRVLLITGANNGGKTFYSKSVGLAQLLTQRGGRIPAEYASVELADKVYTHFVDQDDPINQEGRYKFELRRMAEILDRSSRRSLLIMDEPCSGTDPAQGEVQSSYFLESLAESGARGIFNTHYYGLTSTSERCPAVRNIHPDTRLDNGEIHYTYRMIDGPTNSSYALELARSMKLGRDELLEKARQIKTRN